LASSLWHMPFPSPNRQFPLPLLLNQYLITSARHSLPNLPCGVVRYPYVMNSSSTFVPPPQPPGAEGIPPIWAPVSLFLSPKALTTHCQVPITLSVSPTSPPKSATSAKPLSYPNTSTDGSFPTPARGLFLVFRYLKKSSRWTTLITLLQSSPSKKERFHFCLPPFVDSLLSLSGLLGAMPLNSGAILTFQDPFFSSGVL